MQQTSEDYPEKWTMSRGHLTVRLFFLVVICLTMGAIFLSNEAFRENIGDGRPIWWRGGKRALMQASIVGSRFQHQNKSTAVPPISQKSKMKSLPDLITLNLDDPSLPFFHSEENDTYWSASNQLQPGLVPSIIHFLWCEEKWFTFKQYLSVLSVIRAMRPDKIVIHYDYLPKVDFFYYHTWLDMLKHDFPFLYLEKNKPEEMGVCGPIMSERLKIIFNYLSEEGGMFIGENTWLLKYSPEDRKLDFDFALELLEGKEGYVLLRGGILQNQTYVELLKNSKYRTRSSSCVYPRYLNMGHVEMHCLIVQGTGYEYISPIHIWDQNTTFGRVTRKIFYHTEKILQPVPTYDDLVPNIGHMVWFGGGKMDFMFYLSALSVLYVVDVETLYIHGDQPPKGEYWERLKVNERVNFIRRPEPTQIYQNGIEEPKWFRALMSDFIRVDIMIKYGGIYTDTDAIWVKPLSYEERGYEAVAAFDWIDWSFPFPDSVNFGVSYGKKNAPFWRIFRDTMRTLHNDVHGYTGVMVPYRLLERYPHLLRIDRHLQAICYNLRCHPTWVENYHNESVNHVTTNSIPNWREDLHAFHWTFPNPPELQNETALRNSTGFFAEIGQYVLKKAGLW